VLQFAVTQSGVNPADYSHELTGLSDADSIASSGWPAGFIESIPFDPAYEVYTIYARRLMDGDVTEIDTHAELLALRAREHHVSAVKSQPLLSKYRRNR
jgi:hypothetical protein